MAHEEFGRFRQEIRSWMDSHPGEYDAFVEEMNGKSPPQRDIAMMKVALEEAGITMNCSVRTFRDALQAEFPEYAIVLERGFSAATNSCWIRMHARASCKRISGKTASLSTISQRKLEQSQQDYRRLKNG